MGFRREHLAKVKGTGVKVPFIEEDEVGPREDDGFLEERGREEHSQLMGWGLSRKDE